MKYRVLLIAFLLTLGACSDDGAGATTTAASADTSTTTAVATTAPTTTAPAATTSTEAGRRITGEMRSHEGYWTSVDVAHWSILLEGFDVLAGSSTADLHIEGTWEMIDGVMIFQGIDIDGHDCGDIEGRYRPSLEAEYMILTLIDDACEERADWMRGAYRMDGPG